MFQVRKKNIAALLDAKPPENFLARFALAEEMNGAEVRRLFRELMKFFAIIMAANEPHSPPMQLDKLWRKFILFDTRAYETFCQEHFGCVIYHRETDGPLPRGHMMEVAESLGLTLDPDIWVVKDAGCDGTRA